MMRSVRHGAMVVLLLLLSGAGLIADTVTETVLFQDDFGTGDAAQWKLESIWQVEKDSGDFVLSGSNHGFARAGSGHWANYRLAARLKLVSGTSGVHVEYRSQGCIRYFVHFHEAGITLSKTSPCGTSRTLASVTMPLKSNTWVAFAIAGHGNTIEVSLNGTPVITYADTSDPVLNGSIAFETLDGAHVHFDDVVVSTAEPLSPTPWVSTGGPLGGLGYDVRIHPANKLRMFVTDNFAGVVRSDDAGRTWAQSNGGIGVRSGTTRDAVNIFSLTIDPNNPDIVWAGSNGEGSSFAAFKSIDAGDSWTTKTNGMLLDGESGMVFRGFTVQKGNSNVVYAQAEVPTAVQGKEFNRVKGRVYKTTDGGESWTLVWQGGNLARYLIIDPTDPNILYLSTGIFDREAFDSDCVNGRFGGAGVLKSTDGGQTWAGINTGLTDLYVGALRMHPTNPRVLLAAAGNNACSGSGSTKVSGLFKTSDGGATWSKVIDKDIMTTVGFSPSSPDVAYAGSAAAFYRSTDGGSSWTKFTLPGGPWGPPGIRAGVPIDVVVDPDDPDALYANNYGGGVFRSLDGAATWSSWSNGYSGAQIHMVDVPERNPWVVYAIGRSGPFVSSHFGDDWVGIANGAATFPEWNSVAVKPTDPNWVLITAEHRGVILLSRDGGASFDRVLDLGAVGNDPTQRQGFRGMAFAPSNPEVVVAGLSKDRMRFLASVPAGTVLYKSVNGGTSFTAIPSALDGTNVRALVVDPLDPDLVYAATTSGVYKSTDGAATWTRLAALGVRKIEAIALDSRQPGYLIAGEIFGGIWTSTDAGASWTGPHNTGFSSANPYITSLVLDPSTPDVVFASDLYAGVYRSADRGQTWAPFPDWKMSGLTMRAVTDLAIGDRMMYAATQGGGVFRFALRPEPPKRRAVRK